MSSEDEMANGEVVSEAGVTVEQDETLNFDQWSVEMGLTRKTTALLRKEDLGSLDTLCLLDNSDLLSLDLSVGQRKVLAAAISKIKAEKQKNVDISPRVCEPAPPATVTQSVPKLTHDEIRSSSNDPKNVDISVIRRQAGQLDASGKAFDDLLSQSLNIENNQANQSNKPVHVSDPRTVLTIKATSHKAVHITQFLTEATKKKRQSRKKTLVLSTADNNVVVQRDDDHPYSGISVEEWSAANCRLMAYLMRSGSLKSADVEYYLSYTTQIYDFASKYDWESLLDFDYQYRERQAEHSFVWGAMTTHMELQLLKPKVKFHSYRDQGFWSNQKNKNSSKGSVYKNSNEPCRLYKSRNGNCPFGQQCKFSHDLGSDVTEDNSKNGK